MGIIHGNPPTNLVVLLVEGLEDGAVEDELVHALLLFGERGVEHNLLLGRDGELDVGLEAAEQKGLENVVELADHLLLLLALDNAHLLGILVDVGHVEPALERVQVVKDVGEEKVEQGPQLG